MLRIKIDRHIDLNATGEIFSTYSQWENENAEEKKVTNSMMNVMHMQ